MRFLKKGSVVIAAVMALAAFTAVSASAATGSGSITVTSPTSLTCTFSFTYSGTLPGTVNASGVTLNVPPCPSSLSISNITLVGTGTGSGPANITAGTVTDGTTGCVFNLSGANPGTWNSTPSPWQASFGPKTIHGNGFPCNLIGITVSSATISG
jgi:hypothetical protein